MTFRIGALEIGASHPCAFVAEISNNHNGDLSRALRLIDAAKDADCSAVKFQCFTVDELCALRGEGLAPAPWDHLTVRQLYTKAQTPHAWFPELVRHCREIGMPWFSSVFGEQSLALLESLGCPAYKIARLDNQDAALISAVEKTGKQVVVSEAEHTFESAAFSPGGVLHLLCPPGYPQTSFSGLHKRFCPGFDGLSFHGTDYTPCVFAAAFGARMIEAHVMLDHEPSELEADVSLTASQFRAMIRDIRKVESMLA